MKTQAEIDFLTAVFAYKKKRAKKLGALSASYEASLIHDAKRSLIVSGNPACYGKVNTAVFELEGSPPRHPVIISGMQVGLYEIIIDGITVQSWDVRVVSGLINPALKIIKERGFSI